MRSKVRRLNPPRTERFDPEDIPGLLAKAQAGDLVARDRLLYMFQSMVANLVGVCLSGRVYYRSKFQKMFLRYFGKKDTPIEDTAAMLKKSCADIDRDELFVTGQLAVIEAIERCETNLASTIVIVFKDKIAALIKDKKPLDHRPIELVTKSIDIEGEAIFSIFLDSLEPEDRDIVDSVIAGEKVHIPPKLRKKLAMYLRS